METVSQLLLVLAGAAMLLSSLSVLLALLCLYRMIQQHTSPASGMHIYPSENVATLPAPTAVEIPKPLRRRRKEEPTSTQKQYVCIHCKTVLPTTPHHGIIRESSSLVVYLCANCGKETALPRDISL